MIVSYLRPVVQYLVLGLDPILLIVARLTTTSFVELMGAFSNLVLYPCCIGDRRHSCIFFRDGKSFGLCWCRCVGIRHEPPGPSFTKGEDTSDGLT